MRALCVADNHLGAGPDLGRAPGDRLTEQESVWRRALELARAEDCDVVLHGGDLFHKAKSSPDEVLAALRPLTGHIEAGGCPVVMAIGNHERSGVTEATMPAALAQLKALYVSHAPESVGEFSGITVCALPWAPVSRIVAAAGGGDRDDLNTYAAELLIEVARGLRAQVDGPAILLTHFAISGSSLPNGLPVEQLREPVLELGDLEALGFDAVIAGHIHVPAEFGERVLYVGSPMALNFGEAEVPHGIWIVETNPYSAHFIPIESRRLETLDFEGPPEPPYEVAEALVMDAVVKARIRLTSEEARRFDVGAFKRALYDAGAEKVWAVQLEIKRPERARVERLNEDLDELAALALWMEAGGLNGDQADALHERTERYLGLVRG